MIVKFDLDLMLALEWVWYDFSSHYLICIWSFEDVMYGATYGIKSRRSSTHKHIGQWETPWWGEELRNLWEMAAHSHGHIKTLVKMVGQVDDEEILTPEINPWDGIWGEYWGIQICVHHQLYPYKK